MMMMRIMIMALAKITFWNKSSRLVKSCMDFAQTAIPSSYKNSTQLFVLYQLLFVSQTRETEHFSQGPSVFYKLLVPCVSKSLSVTTLQHDLTLFIQPKQKQGSFTNPPSKWGPSFSLMNSPVKLCFLWKLLVGQTNSTRRLPVSISLEPKRLVSPCCGSSCNQLALSCQPWQYLLPMCFLLPVHGLTGISSTASWWLVWVQIVNTASSMLVDMTWTKQNKIKVNIKLKYNNWSNWRPLLQM